MRAQEPDHECTKKLICCTGQLSDESGKIQALMDAVGLNKDSLIDDKCTRGCMTTFKENKNTESYFVDRACNDEALLGKYPDKYSGCDDCTHVCRSRCEPGSGIEYCNDAGSIHD